MSETKIPILKIFGENDPNVPVKRSLERLNDLLSKQPGLSLTIKIFEDSGHALFNSKTNWIRNDYLNYVTYWISKQ